jgi:hypothetical protein
MPRHQQVNRKRGQIMKAWISTLIAALAVILALAGLAAPIAALDSHPVGSTPWWDTMDREGRGGSGGN